MLGTHPRDVPTMEETDHTQKGLFILPDRRVENAKMADVNKIVL